MAKAVASTAEAEGNLNANAERDISMSSAGDQHNVETRNKNGKKRVPEEDNHTAQKAAEFIAGGDVKTSSGRDTTLVASKVSAGNNLNLLAMEIALLKGAGKYFEGTGASVLVSGGKKEGGLTGNTSKVSEVELNATRDTEGFGLSAQRDFAPGMEHRAENINAGQVTDRDGLPRVDGEKTANDLLLKQQSGGIDPPYWGTQRPALKEGTIVRDSVVDQPRTMTMTINETQLSKMLAERDAGRNPSSALGAWATDTPINSVADVRNKLAVSEEFKSGDLYQIRFTIKPGVGFREGDVGDMWDAKNGVRLPGGGHQVNFMDKPLRTNPELYEVDFDSLRALK